MIHVRLTVIVLLFMAGLSITSTYAHHSSISIFITDEGFSNKSVRIPIGSSITWINKGNKPHWPASDFHPTHTLYPGSGIEKCGTLDQANILDACRELKGGESYSFTFNKGGRWGVHDHLNPNFKMIVETIDEKNLFETITKILSGNSNSLEKLLSKILISVGLKKAEQSDISRSSVGETASLAVKNCNDSKLSGGKYSCYAKEMENIAYNNGPEYAVEVLSAIQNLDSGAKGCHFIAHGIGWGSYKRNHSDWQNLIATSSPVCSYGAQMGIIEYYVNSLPEGKLTKDIIPILCGSHLRADCNHAVGHILLVETKGNLSEAIDFCSVLDKQQNFICLTGVFMERIIASNLVEHGLVPQEWKNWPSRLPIHEKLCRSFNGSYAVACWREIAHPAFYYFSKDPKSIFDFCNTAPLPQAARSCKIHSIPEIASSRNLNLTALKYICTLEQLTDPSFEEECYLNLIGIKISFLGQKNSEDVVDFCSSLDQEFQIACFKRIGGLLREAGANKDGIEKICKAAPPQFIKTCIGGVAREEQKFTD